MLGAGVAATGFITFAYFGVAGHVLAERPYARLALLLVGGLDRDHGPATGPSSSCCRGAIASGSGEGHPLRSALMVQTAAAALFLVLAVALRVPLQDGAFDGSQ